MDGREAMHTVMRAKLDGVPKTFDAYVLKKDGCVYDFVDISAPAELAANRAAFETFVGGISHAERSDRPCRAHATSRRAPYPPPPGNRVSSRRRAIFVPAGRRAARRANRVEVIGTRFARCSTHLGQIVARSSGQRRCAMLRRPFEFRAIIYQMESLGVRSVGIASVTAIFIGMVMAVQFAFGLQKFGGMEYTGRVVGLSFARELAPTLTAVIVGGRIGVGHDRRGGLDGGDRADRRHLRARRRPDQEAGGAAARRLGRRDADARARSRWCSASRAR